MPIPATTDAIFIELFDTLGPEKTAKKLGLTVRAVYSRRRRLEDRTNVPINGPISRFPIERTQYAHRAEVTVSDGVVIVASDAHYWPGEPSVMHKALVAFCKEYKPRAVIFNGDVIDAPQISRHPPIGWETRPKLADEIECAKDRLHEIEKAAFKADKIWCLGNHDCLDASTECLTRRGWLPYTELKSDDQVLSLVDDRAEWSPIGEIVKYPYCGDLVRAEKTRFSFAATPNHRVLLWRLNWRTRTYDIKEYHQADSLPYSFNVPMSGFIDNGPGVALSYDQIRLAGWILTDGCYDKYNISIYQSKPTGIECIESVLERLGVKYSRYERARQAKVICGRQPVGDPLPAIQFSIRAESARKIKEWLPAKGRLPSWANELSRGQFEVFLNAIVAGDGTWDGAENGDCCVIYGTKAFLEDLQAVAVCHGWRARFATDNRGDFRLCLSKIPYLRIERPEIFNEHYDGIVWCLRVPHENFMVRRNGAAYFTGNSRFETRLASVAPEYAKIHGIHLHDHFPLWRSAWAAWINNDVVVKHRFKGGIHAPHNNTMWAGKTVVTGHLHSAKVIPFDDYNGTRYGVDSGCIADTDAKAFLNYTEDNPRSWRSAFVLLTFKGGRLMYPELVLKWDSGSVQFRGNIIGV